jgi:hypothetical protein
MKRIPAKRPHQRLDPEPYEQLRQQVLQKGWVEMPGVRDENESGSSPQRISQPGRR